MATTPGLEPGLAERLQDAGRQEDADAIGDILDVLTGHCSPSARMLPDELDVKL